MASHSSILAWRIPWTEEPGRLQSMESQRVGHTTEQLKHTQDPLRQMLHNKRSLISSHIWSSPK